MRTPILFAAAVMVFGCNNKANLNSVDGSVEPNLTLDHAELWQPQGGINVSGTARGLGDVSVNGTAVSIDEEAYASQVVLNRGINTIEVRGYDSRGDTHFRRQGVLAGQFNDPAVPIQDALTLRLNRGGLDTATGMVEGFIDPMAIGAGITAMNPVYSDSYGVFGWDAVEVAANIHAFDFTRPQIHADPNSGYLNLTVDIPDFEVWVEVEGEIVGIDFDTDAWIGAQNVHIEANLNLDVTPDGTLDVELLAPVLNLEGFWYDLSLIPGDIEGMVLVDTIAGFIEDMLLEKVQEMVPPLLEEQLASLDISFNTELLGKQVGVQARFASAQVDPQGVQLGTNVQVSVPSETTHTYAGYLGSPTADARPSLSDDVSAAVSDNLLNRLFFDAWRANILQMSLDSTKGDIDPVLLSQLGAKDAASLYIDAFLPPVVVQKNGELILQISELMVQINTPDGDMGERLDLAVSAEIGLELAIENNVLALNIDDPNLVIDVRGSDWGVSNNTITALLEDKLPIDTLLQLVGGLEIPLPSIGGLSVGQGQATRDSTGVYTGIGINLQ